MATCQVTDALDPADPLLGELWTLYACASEERRTTRLLRDLLTRDEFDAFLTTPPAIVVVMRDDDGRLIGLCTGTMALEAQSWLEPAAVAERWPDAWAERRLVYLPIMVIEPCHRSVTAFARLGRAIIDAVQQRRLVAFFDVNVTDEGPTSVFAGFHRWSAQKGVEVRPVETVQLFAADFRESAMIDLTDEIGEVDDIDLRDPVEEPVRR